MKYPLEDLMRVRRFREDEAATAVTKQRAQVEAAKRAIKARRREMEEYTQWRIRREQELYDEIMRQPIRMKELDGVKVQVQAMKSKEAEHREAVLQAEKHKEEQDQLLVQRKHEWTEAVRQCEKLVEHKDMWQVETDKEAERQQETEMEDFRTRTLADVEETPDA